MTIASVRLRLKQLQLTIPNVLSSYAQLPRGQVNTADLPLFINFVRQATYDKETMGDDTILVTRVYLMWLLVKPVAEGEEGEGEAIVEPFIESVTTFFYARPTLGNLIGIVDSAILEDSGPKKMVWPGTPSDPKGIYWGVEFQLSVTEVVNRNYSDNE